MSRLPCLFACVAALRFSTSSRNDSLHRISPTIIILLNSSSSTYLLASGALLSTDAAKDMVAIKRLSVDFNDSKACLCVANLDFSYNHLTRSKACCEGVPEA